MFRRVGYLDRVELAASHIARIFDNDLAVDIRSLGSTAGDGAACGELVDQNLQPLPDLFRQLLRTDPRRVARRGPAAPRVPSGLPRGVPGVANWEAGRRVSCRHLVGRSVCRGGRSDVANADPDSIDRPFFVRTRSIAVTSVHPSAPRVGRCGGLGE